MKTKRWRRILKTDQISAGLVSTARIAVSKTEGASSNLATRALPA